MNKFVIPFVLCVLVTSCGGGKKESGPTTEETKSKDTFTSSSETVDEKTTLGPETLTLTQEERMDTDGSAQTKTTGFAVAVELPNDAKSLLEKFQDKGWEVRRVRQGAAVDIGQLQTLSKEQKLYVRSLLMNQARVETDNDVLNALGRSFAALGGDHNDFSALLFGELNVRENDDARRAIVTALKHLYQDADSMIQASVRKILKTHFGREKVAGVLREICTGYVALGGSLSNLTADLLAKLGQAEHQYAAAYVLDQFETLDDAAKSQIREKLKTIYPTVADDATLRQIFSGYVALGGDRTDFLAPWLAKLKDSDFSGMRQAAAYALEKYTDAEEATKQRILTALLDQFKVEKSATTLSAVVFSYPALGGKLSDLTADLLAKLNQPEHQYAAAYVLYQFKTLDDEVKKDEIRKTLTTIFPKVTDSEALGRISSGYVALGGDRADFLAPWLEKLKEDSDASMRWAAANALGKYTDADASTKQTILAALLDQFKVEKSNWNLGTIVSSYTTLGGSLSGLTADLLAKLNQPEHQYAAAYVLDQFKTLSDTEKNTIREKLNTIFPKVTNSDTLRWISSGYVALGGNRTDFLEGLLNFVTNSKERSLRRAAAMELGKFGGAAGDQKLRIRTILEQRYLVEDDSEVDGAIEKSHTALGGKKEYLKKAN